MTLDAARTKWIEIGRKRCPVAQPVSDWQGDVPLPTPIADFYDKVGPDDLYCLQETHLQLYLPALRSLHEIQQAFRLDSWPVDKIVVAHHHTDPFIFDGQSKQVTYCKAGNGEWQPITAFADLGQMMHAFGIIEKYVTSEFANMNDEDDGFAAEFIDGLIARLSTVVDHEVATRLISEMFS